MKQKIQTLLNQLNHGLVEREATLKTALLTMLAGENLVLIGPPGTGKSLIARRIAESFSHSGEEDKNPDYFEYLLTKFSTPEEIFGPLSITELKADRFRRNTAGYLPTVKIAFLDEIFKASSSILNALLTILNERIYHNGSEPQKVSMQALIAASNELPTDQEELSALYDRFLVRGFVDYVSQDNLPRLFEKEEPRPALSKLTEVDLDSIKDSAKSVTIPPEIVQAMQRIWAQHKEIFKEDRREGLSDRRLKKVIKLLCVSAATNGRSEVDLSDVFLLKDCLWNHQTNALKVRELILKTLQSFSRPVPQSQNLLSSAIHNAYNALPTYEVAKDGKTLIQAQPQSTVWGTSSALVQASAKLGAVVKGFKGSGTAQDPLLIQTVEDLMDLSRQDVGLKGYYFRQTADIDCSGLSSWTDIPFKGQYDGSGKTIKSNKKAGMFYDLTLCELFSSIQVKSSIKNLKLKDLRLASTAEGSYITHCFSNVNLVRDTASNCTITDCLIVLDIDEIDDDAWGLNFGGIAKILSKGSLVERCFIEGTLESNYSFYGIAAECSDSTVRQCALGRIILTGGSRLQGRIAGGYIYGSKLENNASIDRNPGNGDINGKDGKTVPAALFKQRYFEHTLNWDFETVWQWDDKEDRPALRSVGIGAAPQQAKPAAQQTSTTDLLTQQIRANIWL